MATALVLSPHLDDAAFSCGGTMAQWADAGWRVCLATAFTRTIHPATGFALACQLDKGLDAEVDYMALRREEDRLAAAILGVADLRWLDLPEAPHRGYESAPALFGPLRDDDAVWRELASLIASLVGELQPDVVLGPQGLGNHADHRQVIRAMTAVGSVVPFAFYRDTPYALRNRSAVPVVRSDGLDPVAVDVSRGLERKIEASCAYASQVGFQFGGAAAVGEALRRFAAEEGSGQGMGHGSGPGSGHKSGRPAERFLSQVSLLQN